MTEDSPQHEVLLISADLFLGSRIQGAVTAKGASLRTVARGESAIEQLGESNFALVLIDLETPGLDIVRVAEGANVRHATPTVAYGPHVKERLLIAAKEAGCTEVLSRGKFDATIGELLNRHLPSNK
ncbi:MAG: hypothetical protein KDA93_02875 [Planctomycetaceae bacterium]|nr:hypothetical protein [Planctomycetaceae bacterium]